MFTKLILLSGIILIGNAMADGSEGGSSQKTDEIIAPPLTVSSGPASPAQLVDPMPAETPKTEDGPADPADFREHTSDRPSQVQNRLSVASAASDKAHPVKLTEPDEMDVENWASCIVCACNNGPWNEITKEAVQSYLQSLLTKDRIALKGVIKDQIDTEAETGLADMAYMLKTEGTKLRELVETLPDGEKEPLLALVTPIEP